MIALVEPGLRRAAGLEHISTRVEDLVLYASPPDEDSDHWRTRDGLRAKPLADWLAQGLEHIPAVNRVVVAWCSPDAGLTECLRTLRALPSQHYRLSLVVLLGGPIADAGAVAALPASIASEDDRSSLNRVLFIGNEDHQGQSIDESRRLGVVGDLLTLLLSVGDNGPAWLGLESGVAAGTTHAFGLRRWGPSSLDIRSLVEQVGHDVLRMELASLPSVGFDKETLEAIPARRLQELRTFGVPLASGNGPAQTPRLAERVSPMPPHPFADWMCPPWRGAAARDGHERIDRHVPEVHEIHRRLLDELPALAGAIRANGHALYLRARTDLRDHVERATRLGDLAALLRHFFPAIRRLRTSIASVERTPCVPAALPTLAMCHKRYRADAHGHWDELVKPLPTGGRLLAHYSLATLLVAAAGYAIAHVVPPTITAIPAVLGLGLGTGTWIWSRWRARKCSEAMRQYLDEADSWLRGAFVAKLEWVVAKTQQTLELQYVTTGEAIGRALGRTFESVFREWQTLIASSPHDDAAEGLQDLGVDADRIAAIRERFRSLAQDIVGSAMREGLGTMSRADLAPILDTLTREIVEELSDHPIPETRVGDELRLHAAQRLEPVPCAHLGEALLSQGVRRTFLLPAPYSQHLVGEIKKAAAPTGIETRVQQARLRGPAAFLMTPALDREAIEDSLTTTQPGTRSKT